MSGFGPALEAGEGDAEIELGAGVIGSETEGFGELFPGWFEAVLHGVFDTEKVAGLPGGGVEGDGGFEAGDGVGGASIGSVGMSEADVGAGLIGLEADGGKGGGDGLGRTTAGEEHLGQFEVSFGPVRLQGHGAFDERLGIVGASGEASEAACLKPGHRVVGKPFPDAVPLGDGTIEIPDCLEELGVAAAEVMIGWGGSDGVGEDAPDEPGGFRGEGAALPGGFGGEEIDLFGVIDAVGEGGVHAASEHDFDGGRAGPGGEGETGGGGLGGNPGAGISGADRFRQERQQGVAKEAGQGVIAFGGEVDVFVEPLRSGHTFGGAFGEGGRAVDEPRRGLRGDLTDDGVKGCVGSERDGVAVHGPLVGRRGEGGIGLEGPGPGRLEVEGGMGIVEGAGLTEGLDGGRGILGGEGGAA